MTEDDTLAQQVAEYAATMSLDPYRRLATQFRTTATSLEFIDLTDNLVPWRPDDKAQLLDTVQWLKDQAVYWDSKADAKDETRRQLFASLEA